MPTTERGVRQDLELLSSLNDFDIGCGLFDREQRLLAWNAKFKEHGAYPAELCQEGVPFAELDRFEQRDCDRIDCEKLDVDERQIDRRSSGLSDGGRIVMSVDATDHRACRIGLSLATDAKENALRDLAMTQRQLGDAERLAALGKLTAGVAHEIKNPLNFINNFSHLSLDLMDEASEALIPAMKVLDQNTKAELDEVLGLMRQNLVKINQHGRRANSIVRTMLMHARRGEDNTQTASPNELVKEVVSLINQDLELVTSDRLVHLELDLSPHVGSIECFPEDLVRALFNLVINAVAAAQGHIGQSDPKVVITTKAIDGLVEINVHDNGKGMTSEVQDQALTPFFTTKLPGEGTGLGLSLSHDVINRQHRGQLTIVSEPDDFTSVTVTLFKHLPERRSGGRRLDDG